MSSPPSREVYQAEALAWLDANPCPANAAIVTSLPDVSESRGMDVQDWRAWFVTTAERLCDYVADDSVTIFYQTDIKHEGRWIDKGYLVQRGAEAAGTHCLWHKIVCRTDAGNVTYGRPAYAHLLCFSRGLRLAAEQSSPDVLPTMGSMTWSRAMGLDACRVVAKFLGRRTPCNTVLDPFCGHGTMLAAANAEGLDAIGVDLSPKRVRKARELRL